MFHIPVFVPDNYDSFIALIGLHQVGCIGYSPDCGGVRGQRRVYSGFSWKTSVMGWGHRAPRSSIPLHLHWVPTAAPLLCFSITSLNLPFARLSISSPSGCAGWCCDNFPALPEFFVGPCVSHSRQIMAANLSRSTAAEETSLKSAGLNLSAMV